MGNTNQKILIVGYLRHMWHEKAWVKSLSEQGYNVSVFNVSTYLASPILGRLQNHFLVGPSILKINIDVQNMIKKNHYNIVIFYQSFPIQVETISNIKLFSPQTLLVSYVNDNPFHLLSKNIFWKYYRKTIPFYDLCIAYRDSDIPNYESYNAKDIYLMHSFYLPWLHNPVKSIPDNFKNDVSFLGHYENDKRDEYIHNLILKNNFKFCIKGSNWKSNSHNRSWRNLDLSEVNNSDYVSELQNTKICLSFFSTLNNDNYTRRVFEIPACGSFLLSERTEMMKNIYVEDREAVYFSSFEELNDKVNFYLKNDFVRCKIADEGYKRCISSGYDIHSRLSKLMKFITKKYL